MIVSTINIQWLKTGKGNDSKRKQTALTFFYLAQTSFILCTIVRCEVFLSLSNAASK